MCGRKGIGREVVCSQCKALWLVAGKFGSLLFDEVPPMLAKEEGVELN